MSIPGLSLPAPESTDSLKIELKKRKKPATESKESKTKRPKTDKAIFYYATPLSLSVVWTKNFNSIAYAKRLEDELLGNGYMVWPDLMSRDDCQLIINQIDTMMLQLPWPGKSENFGMRGLLQQGPFANSAPAWKARIAPKVLEAAAAVNACEIDDLVCSTDAINVSLPENKKKDKSWMHFDQGPDRRGIWMGPQFQLTLTDANKEKGCLKVLEKSHKYYDVVMKRRAERGVNDTKDWIPLASGKAEDEKFLIDDCGCKPKYVEVKAGGGVFWLSTLAHSGHVPQGERSEDKKQALEQARKVIYICYANRKAAAPTGTSDRKTGQYTPFTMAEQKGVRNDLKAKLTWRMKAFLLGRATSHSAIYGHLFPIYPSGRFAKTDPRETWEPAYKAVVATGLAAMPQETAALSKLPKFMPAHLSNANFTDLEIERICRLQGFEKALPRAVTTPVVVPAVLNISPHGEVVYTRNVL